MRLFEELWRTFSKLICSLCTFSLSVPSSSSPTSPAPVKWCPSQLFQAHWEANFDCQLSHPHALLIPVPNLMSWLWNLSTHYEALSTFNSDCPSNISIDNHIWLANLGKSICIYESQPGTPWLITFHQRNSSRSWDVNYQFFEDAWELDIAWPIASLPEPLC